MSISTSNKLMLFAATAVSVVGLCVIKRESVRALASSLCECLASQPAIEADLVRDAFTTCSVIQPMLTAGHTHPNAAALRTSSTNLALDIARYCGTTLYSIQMSKSDQRKGLKGSRQWFWAKDVNSDNRNDDPSAIDIRYMCDVDYYVDMPKLLADEAKPVLLYTFVPESAVSTGVDDTSHKFECDGSLTTCIAGGGSYSHYLWNYAFDSTAGVSKFLGIPYKLVAYAVERKQVGLNRQVILLSPIRVFKGFAAVLAYYLLEFKPVKRFDPIVSVSNGDKFVRFNVQDPSGMTYTTTARAGSWLCATVESSVDDSIATVARLSTTNLMLPTTASWIKDNRPAAAALTEYHRSVVQHTELTVYPVARGVRAYQYKPSEFDSEAKPKLQAFMSPIVHGAFAPVMNQAGEERCVEGRINALRKPEPLPSRFRDLCIDEFANLVVGDALLEPVCYEVVADKQTTAAQKLSLRKATVMGQFRKRILKCFGKAEAYPDIKDPRNISTYNDGDKLDMAQVALALAAHCKKFPWYGPGKTPIEVAQRVADICLDADFVNISDYHRMDGTISYTLRQVERAIVMKAFGNHRGKLNELLKTNVDNHGILPYGTSFEQGPSHGSGCSATSLFQTLRATFCSYLAFRNATLPNGNHPTPEQSFAALGIHCGDDGLDANLPIRNHQWAAQRVGLILEASVVHRGDRGVNFLARYYSPNVWFGCTNSMCDVRRQLAKFHTTVRLPNSITPEQKLVEKAMSYVATDRNTPVLGAFCSRVLVLSSYRPRTLLGIGNWWSRFEDSVQYPNSNVDGWMDFELSVQFPEFDLKQFTDWLDSTKTAQELLSAPICAEPRPATATVVDVVVDDDVLVALQCPASAKKTQPTRRTKTPSKTADSVAKPPRGKGFKPTHTLPDLSKSKPFTNGRHWGSESSASSTKSRAGSSVKSNSTTGSKPKPRRSKTPKTNGHTEPRLTESGTQSGGLS
jgi:hypothetical protein